MAGGRIYSIPDQAMPFKFAATLPFGAEIIKAVATLKPYNEQDEIQFEETFANLGKATEENLGQIISTLQKVPEKERAEDVCVYTTIK